MNSTWKGGGGGGNFTCLTPISRLTGKKNYKQPTEPVRDRCGAVRTVSQQICQRSFNRHIYINICIYICICYANDPGLVS